MNLDPKSYLHEASGVRSCLLLQEAKPEAAPVANPFPWMAERFDLKGKNFFETPGAEYQSGGVLS